ncbi:MAG TPA: amidohydrolase [Longimicrobium sp.]|nr:amidohydrolase [Longimicrobium sp.]
MPPIRRLLLVLLASLLAAGSAAAQWDSSRPANLILTNGKIFTADPFKPWAEAIAIQGEWIMGVGTRAEVQRWAGSGTRFVDLGGRVVVPGFNDAHDHFSVPVDGVVIRVPSDPILGPPMAEVLDSVRAAAARVPRGTWVEVEIGLAVMEDSAVSGGTIRSVLDRVAPDHPVHLSTPWGHGHLANTAGLRAFGIADDARDQVGGWYERDAAGRPNGVLQEGVGVAATRRRASARPAEALGAALRAFTADAPALGITSIQNMGTGLDPQATLRAVGAATARQPLPVRLRIIRWPIANDAGRNPGEWSVVPHQPAWNVRVEGKKYGIDGTPLERLAVMSRPYADRPGWRGRLNYHPDTLRAILSEALAEPGITPAHRQLMLHTVGDSATRLVLRLMQELAPDTAWQRRRLRIEHGDWVTGDMLPVVKRLGIVVVQNPTHFALGNGVVEARYGGPQPGFQPVRDIVEAGIPLAIGSDGPRSPFLNLMFAVMHPNNPAQALTREQAVIAYTRGSAHAEFTEREKGSLTPGRMADLAVLSQDIFTVPVQALPGTRSVLTLLGGRVVHDEGLMGRAPAPASRP